MSSAGMPTYPASTIAKLLMLTERRVQQLAKDGVIPKSERGRYELAPCVQGYIRFLQDRNVTAGSDIYIDYATEKAKKLKAEREKAELEVARMREQLVETAVIEYELTDLFTKIKKNLRNIPNRAALTLVGEKDEHKIKKVLLAEIDDTLVSLASHSGD
mgnify:CR=1 FL=1